MKYSGPPKPIPTEREIIDDKALAIWFVVLAVLLIIILLLTGDYS
jgi:uncharacterized integral membrane protein